MSKPKNPLAQANKARKVKAAARKKEIKSGLAKLKKAGLYTGDVRKASGNSHQASLVKRYSDVISGKAVAVKADINTEIAYRGAGGRGAHGRVIVEKQSSGERIRFNKKTKTIEGKRFQYGNTILRKIYYQQTIDPTKIPKPKKGQTFYYQVRNEKTAITTRYSSYTDFVQEIARYADAKAGKNKAQAKKLKEYYASHVSVEEVLGQVDRDGFDHDDEDENEE